MIKCYPIQSVQRSQLAEAIAIASKIAKCEPNEHTIRATVLYCLERNVEGFPVSTNMRLLADIRQIYSTTTEHLSIRSMWMNLTIDRTTPLPLPPYRPFPPPALLRHPMLAAYTAPCFCSTINLWSSSVNHPLSRAAKLLAWTTCLD
jgi:hypothetical protein